MQSKEQLQKRFRQCSEHIEEYIGSMTEEFYSDGGCFDYGFAVDTMYDIRSWAEEAIGILEEIKNNNKEKELDET